MLGPQKGLAALYLLTGILIFGLAAGGLYYYQKNSNQNSTQESKNISNNPTTLNSPESFPRNELEASFQPATHSPPPTPIAVPSNWKEYTVEDTGFGLITSLSLPPGFVFKSGYGWTFTIYDEVTSTELWDHSSSVFSIDGCTSKNYYDGGSRRAWYQKKLNGDYSPQSEVLKKRGEVLNVTEVPIDASRSYLEVTVKDNSGAIENNYLFVQNHILHILKPLTEPAKSSSSKIYENLKTIFASLRSEQVKPKIYVQSCQN